MAKGTDLKSALERIAHPEALDRPAPFWSWNDRMEEGEVRRQIREMASAGWGSFFMHARVGLVTGYLSDEWMDLTRACVDEAKKNRLKAWLYDEDKWPSGFAGGLVPEKDPSFRQRALLLLRQHERLPGDTVLAETSCDGVDYSICVRISALGDPWFNGASWVDLMNGEAVRAFIDVTHEAYKKAVGDEFGKTIPGIFTDEPCYIFRKGDNVKYPALPWTDRLPEVFRARRGYELRENLSKLFFNREGYEKIRHDFHRTATELFRENFTRPYFDWCEKNSLIMTGHFMAEDSMFSQSNWSGDVMAHYEFMHWPGIDKLGRSVGHGEGSSIVTVKQLDSAVCQLGKERAFSEVFGCVGGQASFFHRKWLADWQAALGISFVNHHLSLYSMRGERKRDYPANFFYPQPWWSEEKNISEYLGRVSAAVSTGKRSVEILVLQPLRSAWCENSSSQNAFSGKPSAIDEPIRVLAQRLMEEKLDFHFGNETLIAAHARVEGKKFLVGECAYDSVVVPPMTTVAKETWDLLRAFAGQGGRLLFLHHIPPMMDAVPAELRCPEARVIPGIEDLLAELDGAYTRRIRVKDVLTSENAKPIFIHSRSLPRMHGRAASGASDQPEGSLHFFANTSEDRGFKTRIELGDHADGEVEIIDLQDGKSLGVSLTDGSLEIDFAPAGSLLLRTGV